jgi:peroxiredoxin/uncharacterized membrane protein
MQYLKNKPSWWIKAVLLTAAVYSFIWGILIVVYPSLLFRSNALETPNYIFLWQTLGLAELIFGIGLFIASFAPFRHWALIFLALLFKIFASVIYFNSAFDNENLWSLTNYIFIDNIIWVVPFAMILYQCYLFSYSADYYELEFFSSDQFTLDMFETNEGVSIQQLSEQQPVLLVFLRHFGCTFCREAMQDIARQRKQIEAKGVKIVIVHMLDDEDAAYEQLKKYGLQDVATVSDPEKLLYKKFRLRRGTLNQLAGIKVWIRGIKKGLIDGLGIGAAMGDIYQMPGIFLLHRGKVVKQFIHRSAADRPYYVELAELEN